MKPETTPIPTAHRAVADNKPVPSARSIPVEGRFSTHRITGTTANRSASSFPTAPVYGRPAQTVIVSAADILAALEFARLRAACEVAR